MRYSEWEREYLPSHPLETYGADLEKVLTADTMTVWTEVENDGHICILSGFHFVNRLRYFVTEVPYQSFIEVYYDV